MLLPLLLAQAATPAPTPVPTPSIAPLERQALPARGCAAYLWSVADRSFVAVAAAEAATLRIKVDGRVVDLARNAAVAPGGYGLPAGASFAGGGLAATLRLTMAARDDLANGGMVPTATMTLRGAGSDELVVPLAGVVGCSPSP